MQTVTTEDPTTDDGAPAAGSLTGLKAQIEHERAEAAAADRERLELGRELRDLEEEPLAQPNRKERLETLRARGLAASRRCSKHRETADRLEREYAGRSDLAGLLRRRHTARPDELADGLELATAQSVDAERLLMAHDEARTRMLRNPMVTADNISRHDAARLTLEIALERCAAVQVSIEEALAAARAKEPELVAAFERDLATAKKMHAEGVKAITRYVEHAEEIATILDRLREIDVFLARLRERGDYLDRADQVPETPNAVRGNQLPLYATGLESAVVLAGKESQKIWPRWVPRGGEE